MGTGRVKKHAAHTISERTGFVNRKTLKMHDFFYNCPRMLHNNFSMFYI